MWKARALHLWTWLRHPWDMLFLRMCRRRNVNAITVVGLGEALETLDQASDRLRKSGSLNDGTSRHLAVRRKLRADLSEVTAALARAVWLPRWIFE